MKLIARNNDPHALDFLIGTLERESIYRCNNETIKVRVLVKPETRRGTILVHILQRSAEHPWPILYSEETPAEFDAADDALLEAFYTKAEDATLPKISAMLDEASQ